MGRNTKIEWADHSFNFWWGCTKIAPGCKNCYAEGIARRVGNDIWGGSKPRRLIQSAPSELRKLNAECGKEGRVDTVFINDMSDFFEDHTGPVVDHKGRQLAVSVDDVRRDAWQVFDECQHLIFMLLTKRPQNIRPMWPERDPSRGNVWLGCSFSDQKTYNENIHHLLAVRDLSPVLFGSAEPLLGDIKLDPLAKLDWIIYGGESGQKARECNRDWIERGVYQARKAGTACFVKQLGSRPVYTSPGMKAGPYYEPPPCGHDPREPHILPLLLNHPKGGDPDEWPPWLRVREFPMGQK